uniref:Uncharacterized protein n=1 Tax=Glossina palpalis gambiensis TaxID=67801 RepID=A0A1B0B552_9MUSC
MLGLMITKKTSVDIMLMLHKARLYAEVTLLANFVLRPLDTGACGNCIESEAPTNFLSCASLHKVVKCWLNIAGDTWTMKFGQGEARGAGAGVASYCGMSWFGAAVICAITAFLRQIILQDKMIIAAALMANAESSKLDFVEASPCLIRFAVELTTDV